LLQTNEIIPRAAPEKIQHPLDHAKKEYPELKRRISPPCSVSLSERLLPQGTKKTCGGPVAKVCIAANFHPPKKIVDPVANC